ncbi:MAG TPA: hypothetical protein VJT49_14805 [Amycolatopsis sp.]|uniref:hypothetical protein n=1 Tax=Amycolatopsis sp. TaxID=37632 RepID=UPI002B4680A8|nr:hypothetical protein [Amycolatopsis sp.]HKS46348.1 hypothetical protein [Amycolatopsis sp.]
MDQLAADLEGVPEETRPRFRKVVERGALNIKNGMRADASGHRKFIHFPRSISYDMTGDLEAEIGPDKALIQGALGNLLYFGTSRTAGVLDINGPLNREVPRMMDAIADVAEDIL